MHANTFESSINKLKTRNLSHIQKELSKIYFIQIVFSNKHKLLLSPVESV